MGCDLCGKEGQLYKAKIEGTVMTVCDSCKTHGEILERLPTAQELKQQEKQKARVEEPSGFSSASRSFSARESAPTGEVLLLVRNDYGKVIKEARESRGLKQEVLAQQLGIKESLLHKYETGGKKPDLESARMLEKTLRITLVEQHIEEKQKQSTTSSGPLTIADMIKRK